MSKGSTGGVFCVFCVLFTKVVGDVEDDEEEGVSYGSSKGNMKEVRRRVG